MVGVAAVEPPPDPDVDARGRDRPAVECDRVAVLLGQRVLDEDLDRRSATSASPPTRRSPPQSTTKLGIAREPLGEQVGRQPLADAAGVEAQSRRAPDDPERLVDLDLPPAGPRVGVRRAPRRGEQQGFAQRGRARLPSRDRT